MERLLKGNDVLRMIREIKRAYFWHKESNVLHHIVNGRNGWIWCSGVHMTHRNFRLWFGCQTFYGPLSPPDWDKLQGK